MLGLNVKSTADRVVADIDASTAKRRTALARALNRAAGGVKTDASTEIRKTYKVKKATVDKSFSVTRASAARLVAVVRVRGRPLSIAGFGARQTRKGVTVSVKGARKLIPGAFLRKMMTKASDDGEANAYNLVFIRKGKSRFPLKAIKTVDVPGVFKLADVQAAVDAGAFQRFEVEARRQIDFILKAPINGR